MANQTLQNLLEEREFEQDDALALASLTEDSLMLSEGLEELLFEGNETPVEATDVSALQFHSQDNLSHLSDSDLEQYNPDNTDVLNNEGKGSGSAPQGLVSYLVGNQGTLSEGEEFDSEEDDESDDLEEELTDEEIYDIDDEE